MYFKNINEFIEHFNGMKNYHLGYDAYKRKSYKYIEWIFQYKDIKYFIKLEKNKYSIYNDFYLSLSGNKKFSTYEGIEKFLISNTDVFKVLIRQKRIENILKI
jgi:hypothetical protein